MDVQLVAIVCHVPRGLIFLSVLLSGTSIIFMRISTTQNGIGHKI